MTDYEELKDTLRYLAGLKYQTHTIHATEALRQAADAIVALQALVKELESELYPVMETIDMIATKRRKQ